MMSFLKYIVYALLFVVLYIVGKGFYDGNINNTTTVGEIGDQIATESVNMLSSSARQVRGPQTKQIHQHQ